MSKRVERFEDLYAWQKARALYRTVRELTRRPNFSRDYPLVDQMTRAARSTMANIAEGFERHGSREFAHQLSYANGSNAEVRSDLYCAVDSGYIEEEEMERFQSQAIEVGRLVGALRLAVLRSTEKENG